MVTPFLIRTVYWIATVIVIVVGLALLIAGEDRDQRMGGLLALILGPLVVRIYAELSLLLFRMNETLTEIKNNTERKR